MRHSPLEIIPALSRNGLLNFVSDKSLLKFIYYAKTGERLNLKTPKKFNEKLQWLKLYDRRPEYTNLVDKLAVRDYVSQNIGSQYLVPLIGVYTAPEDIPWEELPRQFVLKCTHGSGCNIICRNKDELDLQHELKRIRGWLRKNYYWTYREWPYKDVIPRIIIEKFLTEERGEELKDYKVYYFGGKPKIIHVDLDKYGTHKRNIYDLKWNLLEVSIQYPVEKSIAIPKPENLELMLDLGSKLVSDFPHARVDFYSIGEKLYFSEITFYNGAGFERILPEQFNFEMGEWLVL